jgi:pimeloyl-ACP methyl ester carboxylesterase
MRASWISWIQWRSLLYRKDRITWEFCRRVVTYKRAETSKKPYLSLLKNTVNFSGSTIDLNDALVNATQPALLVWGDTDRVIPQWQGTEFVKRHPRFTLVEVPHCGHIPHLERPFLYNRMVRAFIDDTR